MAAAPLTVTNLENNGGLILNQTGKEFQNKGFAKHFTSVNDNQHEVLMKGEYIDN